VRCRLLILSSDEIPVVGSRQPRPAPHGGTARAVRRHADSAVREHGPGSIVLTDGESPVGHSHRKQLAVRGDTERQNRRWVLGSMSDLECVELKDLGHETNKLMERRLFCMATRGVFVYGKD